MIYEKGSFCTVYSGRLKDMDYLEQAVYLWISFHSNQDGECFPSVQTLAEETKMSRRQIFYALKSMEDKGIIRRNNRKGSSSIYQIIVGRTNPPVQEVHTPRAHSAHPPVQEVHTELNSVELNKITKEPASLLKDFKPDYTILKSTDPAWEDVVTYYRKAGKKAYIQGDKASFYDGEWHVFGNQGWVSTSLSVRENIVFK
jgi:DNA-binding GntR family transcriptional regulator